MPIPSRPGGMPAKRNEVIQMRLSLCLPLLLAIALSACTPQQLYTGSGPWRQSLCAKQADDARASCEAEASKTYGEYKRDSAPSK